MKIDIVTLFPDLFTPFLKESIIKRAIEKQAVTIEIHDLRTYSQEKNQRVDDYPFGGGAGMVLMVEPVYLAIQDLKKQDSKVILLTPQGTVYNQTHAKELSKEKHLIFICGHYEGFDERIRNFVDLEYSIGDFVLTGGEIPSMAITDSIVRLLDGVIKKESYENDSFQNGLLDYPQYTKPRDFKGLEVPSVLLSGHHKNIETWRKRQQWDRTMQRRPDLIEKSVEHE